jgi:hypothetical protein
VDHVQRVIQEFDRHDFERGAVLVVAEEQQPFKRSVWRLGG